MGRIYRAKPGLWKGSTWRYINDVTSELAAMRVFKTAWFAKVARKAAIKDDELCRAIGLVASGQASDLGGGVFKKRLNRNDHRGVILAKGKKYWVYAYLFAKKDRANLTDGELTAFRELAILYAIKTGADIELELKRKVLVEICDGVGQKI